jgi:hypothetical protein
MKTVKTAWKIWSVIASASSCLMLMTGCGMTGSKELNPGASLPVTSAGSFSGRVHGGQQPVSGSSVYLYAVSTTGYSNAATSLLTGANVATDTNGNGYVMTDAGGNFTITGDYTCPTATSLVYLLAAGGNPGLANGTNNQSLKLAAALGNCATLKANAATTFVVVNEVSTVAMGYALAGFTATPTGAGASSTNLAGITNAFATAGVLVNTTTGTAPVATPSGNGVVPQAELYTLADVLASCVNSTGAVTGPSNPTPCYSLFAATSVAGVMPDDTMQALLNIAHNPSSQVAAVAMLVTAQAPFAPMLTNTPNDWTMAINFTGSGIHTPQAVSIDASGNAWVANASNTISELSAGTGSALSGANGFAASGLDAPVSLAVDTLGQVWIANCGTVCSSSGNPSSVTLLNGSGQSTNYTSSGLSGAYAIAIGGANQPWVANTLASSLTQLNSAGATTIASDIAADLISPVSVAVDSAGHALTVSPINNALVGFDADGSAYGSEAYQGSALNYPYAIAIDHAGHEWVANHGNNTVIELSGGALVGPAPYSGGGITTPVAIAIDGAGNAWVANTNGTLSELSNTGVALSPASGLRNDLVYPNGVSIDGAGNVWVTNCGAYCVPSSGSSGSVTFLIGVATPVVTPLALGALNNTFGSEP